MSDSWTVVVYRRDQNETTRAIIKQLLDKAGLRNGAAFPFTNAGLAEAESLRAKVDKILEAHAYPRAQVMKTTKT